MKGKIYLIAILCVLAACGEDEVVETKDAETADNDMAVLIDKFYNDDAMTISYDDENIYINTTDIPDHKSMYFETSHIQYEDYSEPSNPEFKHVNNFIQEQNYDYTIPRFPVEQTGTKETSAQYPKIGIAVNGVVLNSGNAAIQSEVNTFDQYEGHPDPIVEAYHHHTEPAYIVETKGEEALMGIMLDGFPIYGIIENGVELTANDLDEYHGHFGVTEDFPNGIYHYHFTSEVPWLINDAFYGVVGTVTE